MHRDSVKNETSPAFWKSSCHRGGCEMSKSAGVALLCALWCRAAGLVGSLGQKERRRASVSIQRANIRRL